MSKIYVIDDIDITKAQQTIRLKKKYNITLLNLFPLVLEHIIHDYVDDIIHVEISITHDYTFVIHVRNQFINYIPLTFSYIYRRVSISEFYYGIHNVSSNVCTRLTYDIYIYHMHIHKL